MSFHILLLWFIVEKTICALYGAGEWFGWGEGI